MAALLLRAWRARTARHEAAQTLDAQVHWNETFAADVKFLGSKTVAHRAVKANFCQPILAKLSCQKKTRTKPTCTITISRGYISVMQERELLHMFSVKKIRDVFVGADVDSKVFGYVGPNPWSGTYQLFVFKVSGRINFTAHRVRAAFLKEKLRLKLLERGSLTSNDISATDNTPPPVAGADDTLPSSHIPPPPPPPPTPLPSATPNSTIASPSSKIDHCQSLSASDLLLAKECLKKPEMVKQVSTDHLQQVLSHRLSVIRRAVAASSDSEDSDNDSDEW